MKLIKPSFLIKEQEPGLLGIYRQIEYAGRICYKSSDKITEDSAKPFVDRMLSLHHGSVLEHGTVYLTIPFDYIDISSKLDVSIVSDVVEKYKKNPYTKWWLRDNIFSRLAFITTNYRVLMQGDYKTWEEASKNNYNKNWLNDLEYLCEPTEFHEKRITVHFTCNRGVWNEFIRHRVLARTDDTNLIDEDAERLFSFSQESQRYCNYSADKFGNEVTFIIPCWMGIPEGKYTNISKQSPEDGEYKQIMLHENNINAYPLTTTPEGRFLWNCYWSEHDYFDLLEWGWKPQQAREVLSNACKTELVMTGFVDDWKHFFELRCDKSAHPQARELAIPLREEFVKRGYINE